MKKMMLVGFGLVLVVTVFIGCSSSKKGSGEFAGQEITILGSYHEDMIKKLAEMFEEKTGAKVHYLRMPTGEATAKLTVEAKNPTMNVYIGGTVDAHEKLKKEGVLIAYKSPIEKEIDSAFIDPDGVWKAQYVEALSIGINEERWAKDFAPKGIKPPTTLEELLNPAFKGEIITPDPATSGTGYTFLSSVLFAMGEQKGWDFITKFNAQVAQYTSSGYTPAEKMALGEFAIAVNFLADQMIVKTKGYPVKSTVYVNAGWSMCPVSLINGSKDNKVAQAFIDFCLTKEALDELVKIASVLAVRSDNIAPEGGQKLSDLPINKKYSPVKSADTKTANVGKFAKIKAARK